MRMEKSATALIKKVYTVNTDITEKYAPKTNRMIKLTGAACTANVILGLGKLLLGIYSLSFFTCVSALYTFGIVIAKYLALAGLLKSKNAKEQYRHYFLSGAVLMAASVAYIAYSVRLFFHPATSVYHMYVALLIATFTFFEITINLRGAIMERHNQTPLFHAIRMINLASSLICLVLTQTAILSFADTQTDLHPGANGVIGVVMGICAALLGLNMVIRIRKIQKEKNYAAIFRKLKRLMKKEFLPYKVKPVRYVVDKPDGTATLYISFQDELPKEKTELLYDNARQKLNIELVAVA